MCRSEAIEDVARILRSRVVHKLLIVGGFIAVITGCGGGYCEDSDSAGPDRIVLRNDGFVVPGDYGLYGPLERLFPYDQGSPFLKCRTIGGIFFEGANAILDSDHYPLLGYLGALGVGVGNTVGVIDGFDGVTSMGSISDLAGGVASIGRITGFNGVEYINSLECDADLIGFGALREVRFSLLARNLPNRAALERVGGSITLGPESPEVHLTGLREVGGDFLIEATLIRELELPALTRIGGNLMINGNDLLRSWSGLPPGSVIEGSFEGTSNRSLTDQAFDRWLSSGTTSVLGSTHVCGNGREGQGRPCQY